MTERKTALIAHSIRRFVQMEKFYWKTLGEIFVQYIQMEKFVFPNFWKHFANFCQLAIANIHLIPFCLTMLNNVKQNRVTMSVICFIFNYFL